MACIKYFNSLQYWNVIITDVQQKVISLLLSLTVNEFTLISKVTTVQNTIDSAETKIVYMVCLYMK